ncbi:MAG TPA: hypothetical protein VHG32_25875 [Thermoanaerobaculia bacterium]|jgi:hypothetical protein|nr:hypothetical protein [Thermoanaerobaculia bacterium]
MTFRRPFRRPFFSLLLLVVPAAGALALLAAPASPASAAKRASPAKPSSPASPPAPVAPPAVAAMAADLGPTATTGPIAAKSYSKLAFGPGGILFLGDSIGARIYALDLDDRKPVDTVGRLEIRDLETTVAAMLGADARDVLIHDLAVNPISKNAYLTVSRGKRGFRSQWQLPNDVAAPGVLLRVTPAGEIQEVRLDNVRHAAIEVANPINEAAEDEDHVSKLRVDAISDMSYADGKLFVAGLSNEEFSSTMRVYPFPFAGPGSATSLEIYHGSHGRYESNSPIRAFLTLRMRGKPYLFASYLCTPLVLFPLDELQDKRHVKGKTIAELGDGDYPLDMVAFKAKGTQYVMVVTSARGVLVIKADDLSQPRAAITRPVRGTAAVPGRYVWNPGILQVENYGDERLLVLARNVFNGQVSLSTMPVYLE